MTPVTLAQASDPTRYGAKAAHLARALAAGLRVPDGVALSCDTVEHWTHNAHAARAAAAALPFQGPVAVRSSALGEDGAQQSFAGIHATLLNVTGPQAIVDAVCAVHASAQSAAAVAYRTRMGLGAARMAVLVQAFVPAQVSGVAFTVDPVTGARQLVVEATWGLGESLVGGLVTPDRFRLGADGQLIARELGEKDVCIQATSGGGTAEQEVAADRVHAACLDADQLSQLHELVQRCRVVFSTHEEHDIEWCWAAGNLYLLQRRPITRAGAPV